MSTVPAGRGDASGTDPDDAARRAAAQLARPEGPDGERTMDKLDASNAGRIATCIEAARIGPGSVAADVGFGGGIGLALLLEAVTGTGLDGAIRTGTVHGVELSSDALTRARRRFGAEMDDGLLALHEGTLEAMPVPDGALDGLVSTNTVYFVPELAPVASELARVLAPGGRAVLGIADSDRMREIGMPLHGFHLRPVDDIVDELTAGGALEVADRQRLDDLVDFTVLVLTRPGGG